MIFPESILRSANPIARLLVAYDTVRAAAGGATPTREAIGLEQLRGLLGWEFFAEWVAPDSISVRLSGTHIDYMLGTNVTRVNFFTKYTPEQRAEYGRFYGAITDHPCGGYAVRRVVVGGAETFDHHSIFLPLAPKPAYVPILGGVTVTNFARIARPTARDTVPDFRDRTRIGVFDIGAGLPALASPFEALDIGAIVAEIDARGPPMLDQEAHEARSLIGRPPKFR
jgi:hypothetical protein